MAKGVPAGASDADIKVAEREQEFRVAFEEEKAQYLTDVAAYETMAQTYKQRQTSGFEYQDPSQTMMPPPDQLMVPERFTARSLEGASPFELQGYDWADAQNLGFNRDELVAQQRSEIGGQYYGKFLQDIESGAFSDYYQSTIGSNTMGAVRSARISTANQAMEAALSNARTMSASQIASGDYLKGTRFESGYYRNMFENYMKQYNPNLYTSMFGGGS